MKKVTKQIGKIIFMMSVCFAFLLFSKELKVEAYEYTASNNYITYNGWGLITTEWNNTGGNNSYYRECYWYRPNGTHHHTSSDQGLSMQTKYSIAEAYQYAEGNWSTKFRCKSQNGTYWSDHSANGGHYDVMNIWISHPSIGTATAPSSYYTWGDAGCWSKFSTSCSGRGTLSYQWQYYNPNSGAWQNIVASDFNGSTGINSTDLNLGTGTGGYPLSLNGYQVRCVVTATYANAKTCRFYNNTYQNDTWTGNTTCTSTSSGAYTYAYPRPSITLTTTNPTGTSVDVVGVLSSANGVARVEYPTWTDNGGQDDMIWHIASLSGTTATYNVKSTEHNNETGEYITHAYVYTSSGEKVSCHNCVIRYTLGKSFELDPNYPEDKEIVLLEGAERSGEDAIFSVKFETLGSPNGSTYEWHSYDTNTDEDIILSGQNDPITFAYTGDVQEYEVPYTGYYMLETWGAQGSAIFDGTGGQGGYSGGMIYLEKGQILYIVIGGQNGYNGGGSGGSVGGGATHIALDSNRGTLSNYESYKSEVLVVAGGGGGSERTIGGFGGGLTGGTGSGYSGYSSIAQGGTQTTGGSYGINSNGTFSGSSGSFGQGGSGSGSDTGPGGGGGWYGGGGTNYAGGAGGGSGYIDGLEKGVTQSGIRTGNGQARITYMSYTVKAEDINTEKNGLEFYCVVGQGLVSDQSSSVTFDYTGGIQEYTAPFDGYYQLETWGAQGGNDGTGTGGKGGYSSGKIWLKKGQVLYVCIGGQGASAASGTGGGYNGGGNAGATGSSGSGGGATHIALGSNRGVLSNYELYKSEILIVAGGGGGGGNSYGTINGGYGGGTSGQQPNGAGIAGSQTGGYAFGQGGNQGNDGGGGGGGWYGGFASNGDGGGSGGSGYIDALESGVTQNDTRTGNGQAKISYMRSSTTESSRNALLTVNTTPMLDELYPEDAITKIMLGDKTASDDVLFHLNLLNMGTPPGATYKWYKADAPDALGELLVGQNDTVEFEYNGEIQEFIAPYEGYYQLETWGAQGGSLTDYSGGKGGYSVGCVYLKKGEVLYIVVGGAGTGATDMGQSLTGGYNGGGNVYGNSSWNHICASGGGATHIAKSSGILSSLVNDMSQVLIVAGGGGGARDQLNHVAEAKWGNGGIGGGVNGGGAVSSFGSTTSFTVVSGNAGTQSYGYAFGQGGSATGQSAGGGGWYGGYDGSSGPSGETGSGSGGSGYIGGVEIGDMQSGVNEGNGKVAITYMSCYIPASEITKEMDGLYYYCEVDHEQGKFFSRSAELIVYYAPIINETKPDDATVYAGDDAVFMADVSTPGNPAQYQYQWYVRKGPDAEPEEIAGANGQIYTAKNVDTDMDGWTYFCDIIHPCGTQTTREALLTVKVQLPVLLGPNYPEFSEEVVEYNTATFFVEIETPGIPDDYDCAWQYRPDASSMWEDCDDSWFRNQCNYSQDENGFVMNISDVPRALHGYQFRLTVHIGNGKYEVITPVANLTVYYDPIFVSPMDLVVIENTTATFNLQFTDMGNNPEIKVKWMEIDTAGNHSEVQVDTLTKDMLSTYSFTALRTDNGNQYYCIIEPSKSGNLQSDKANLTVCYPPTLDTSKPEDMVLEDGRSGVFETAIVVAGFPDVYTYQWYYATAQSPDTWNKMDGSTSPTITINATKDMNGNRYKCVVSQSYPMGNDNYYTQDVTSRIATLTVYYAPILDAEYPKDVNTVLNKGVSFEVKIATAGNPNEYQYQWFKKANAEAEGVAIDGATNPVYAISNLDVTKELNNTYYYCKVYTVSPHATYGHYEVTSRTARLVVYYTPILNDSCPQDFETNEGEDAFFDVIIATDGYSTNYQYQWYENTKDESAGGTPIDGATERELLLTNVSREKNGKFYYCVVTNEGGEVYSDAAKLTVYYKPTDDKEYPKDVTVVEGQSATFQISIATAGNPKNYTYKWYSKRYGDGTVLKTELDGTQSSYTIGKTTKSQNGLYYYCEISNRAGTITTREALLTVYYVPELDASYPQNTTVVVGNTAEFEVKIATKGNPDSYTYQWYVKENASAEGKVINGATNIKYTTEKTTDSMDGYLYYCKVTNAAGTVTSNEAVLTVLYPVKLNGEYPKDAETYEEKTATFEVKVATHGNPKEYTYQWFKATSETAIGIEIAGATNASYTTPATSSADNDTYYFCKVTNSGGVATSRRAKLTVYYKPILDATYPQNITVHDGNSATFKVVIATKGNPDSYTYQWFKEDGTKINGATGSSYTLTGTKALHETKYYCQVTNKAGTVTSKTATLFVKYLPVLDGDYPKDLTVVVNNEATFEVVIKEDGNPATYSYQWYENGVEMTGEISSVLTLDTDYVTKAVNKNTYHCVVRNEVGTVTSRKATLHVLYPNELNPLYPEDVTVIMGETATFKVVIEELGTGTPSYQWYSSKTNKNTGGTKISGATSDTYSVVANAKSMNNTYYYCEVSNDGGMNVSRAAKLTVYYTPVLNTSYPEDFETISGQKATFEVKVATAGNPNSYTYQWYNQNGKIDGATGRVYSFITANSNDKDIYYCKVTNAAGTVTSESATLRVWWKATLDMEYPKDVEEIEGNPIAFEVKIASAGNPDDYIFQWYMADNVGDLGTLIDDGTAITYETIAHRSMDEKYFYCTVTNKH